MARHSPALEGRKFGRLTAISRLSSKSKDGRFRWLCRCDCGKETTSPNSNKLLGGHTRSCGCLRSERAQNRAIDDGGFWGVFRSYKKGAEARNLAFEFDKYPAFFYLLTQEPCHYCGTPANQHSTNFKNGFCYNGIDRVDNSNGYTIENSVPCCGVCNRAKTDRDVVEFLTWTARVTEYQNHV
jgi:hypothetical protein